MPGVSRAAAAHPEAPRLDHSIAQRYLGSVYELASTGVAPEAWPPGEAPPASDGVRMLPVAEALEDGTLLLLACTLLSLAWLARAAFGQAVGGAQAATLVAAALAAACRGAARLGPAGAPLGAALVVTAWLLPSIPPLAKAALVRLRGDSLRAKPQQLPPDAPAAVAATP